MGRATALTQRVRATYPFHVIRAVEGQPRVERMDRTWEPFGRVIEAPGVNRWCFATAAVRQEFINLYGGTADDHTP